MEVVALPIEATALGNLKNQMQAKNENERLADIPKNQHTQ